MTLANSKPAAPRARNAAASRRSHPRARHRRVRHPGRGRGAHRRHCRGRRGQQGPALLLLQGQRESLLRRAAGGLQRAGGGCAADAAKARSRPGEKLLRFARAHFEYLIHHPNYPRLIQQELSRARNTGEPSRRLPRHQHGALHSPAARRAAGRAGWHRLRRIPQGGRRQRAEHDPGHECFLLHLRAHHAHGARRRSFFSARAFAGTSPCRWTSSARRCSPTATTESGWPKKIAAAPSALPRELRGVGLGHNRQRHAARPDALAAGSWFASEGRKASHR